MLLISADGERQDSTRLRTRPSGHACGSAPCVRIALQGAEDKFFDHDHEKAEDKHRDDGNLGAAGASADREHVADALGHAYHLRGNDDAPREAEAGTKAGDKIGDEAWKQDSVHDPPSIGAQGAGRVDQPTVYVMHALDGAEEDWEDGADGNDEYSSLIAQAKPEDGDGNPSYAGNRREQSNDWVGKIMDGRRKRHRYAERDSDHRGEEKTAENTQNADGDVI